MIHLIYLYNYLYNIFFGHKIYSCEKVKTLKEKYIFIIKSNNHLNN